AGFTTSSAFPKVSAYDSTLGKGDVDAFVTKVNAAGTALLYSTYLGGSASRDLGLGIAIDTAGNAYITGDTDYGVDFPTTSGAYQKASTGGTHSFVTKLAPAGNALVYSTYVLNASSKGIAVDG